MSGPVYDKADRLVGHGPVYNPFGTQAKGWLVNKYDAHSRVIFTAFYNGTTVSEAGRKTFQDNLNNIVLPVEKKASSTTLGGAPVTYTNTVFPTAGLTVLSVNYYDDYTFSGAPSSFTAIEGQNVLVNVKGLLTGSWTRALSGASANNADVSYFLYDCKSNVLRQYTKNYLGGYHQVDTKYSFSGMPLKTIVKQQHKSSSVVNTLE